MRKEGKCSVEGCEKTDIWAKGLCRSHYRKSIKNVVFAKTLLCSIGGCDRKSYASGMCRLHYKRSLVGSTDDVPLTPCIVCGGQTTKPRQKYCGAKCRMKWHRKYGCYTEEKTIEHRGKCSVEGCEKSVKANGFCASHDMRNRRYGDPNITRRKGFGSLICINCGAERKPSSNSSKDLCARCYPMDFYYKNHERDRAKRNARRDYLAKVMPLWADVDAIIAFYVACPDDMEVDHIIPVNYSGRGKKVCG